jgi:hypothetical protein
MRRTLLALLALAASATLLVACGDDDDSGDGGDRSELEQAHVDAWLVNLTESDEGLQADEDDARCMAEAIVDEVGTAPFEEADVTPEEIEGGDSPGQLAGDGAISEDQARAVIDAWDGCGDVARLFAVSGASDFGLDDDGVDCLAERLDGSDAFDAILVASFTSASGEPQDAPAVAEFLEIIEACSGGESGPGVLQDSIADSLAEDGTLTGEQAQCLAASVIDAVGQERLLELSMESGDFESAPAEVQQEMAEALVAAAGDCDVPISALGG